MYRIDDDLKELIESGVSVIIGTADGRGRPHLTFGWGPRVHEDRLHVSVFVDLDRAPAALRDLKLARQIAVTFAHPVSYRSIQLKGPARVSRQIDATARAQVERHRQAFTMSTALVGDPPDMVRNLWIQDGDLARIDFDTEQAFDQTPGPSAGQPL